MYDKDSTEALGKPVFTFRGFFLVTYDSESFVSFKMSYNDEDISELNFYSKNKAKAQSMTKEKMEAYVSSY